MLSGRERAGGRGKPIPGLLFSWAHEKRGVRALGRGRAVPGLGLHPIPLTFLGFCIYSNYAAKLAAALTHPSCAP